MEIDRTRTGDQDRCPRNPAGGPAQQRGNVFDGFRLLAKLVVFAVALIVMGTSQALAFDANIADAAVDIVTHHEPTICEEYPLEAIEERPEPLIVDDIRTATLMA